jgi:hypothetical protein
MRKNFFIISSKSKVCRGQAFFYFYEKVLRLARRVYLMGFMLKREGVYNIIILWVLIMTFDYSLDCHIINKEVIRWKILDMKKGIM